MYIGKLSFLIGLFFALHLHADDQAAWSTGKDEGRKISNYYGNMNDTLFRPLTGDSTFTTMDSKTTFKANMACNEQRMSFMKVSFSPASPQNGARIVVDIDKNLDGSKELNYVAPVVASGICQNGVVVCPNGTFAGNCDYYKWNYDGNQLSLIKQTDGRDMIACLCVNDSCGRSTTLNAKSVTGKIGEALYSLIASVHPSYILSSGNFINDNTLEFFGQNSQACQNYQGQAPQGGLNTSMDPSAEQIKQSGEQNSAYTALMGSSANYADNSPKIKSELNTSIQANSKIIQTRQNTRNSTDFSVQDINSTTRIDGHVGIPLEQDTAEYCQVTFTEMSADVFTDNKERTSSTTNASRVKTETRECVAHICPVQPSKGEKIKHGCGNINNFAEATTTLMAIQELANDFSCGQF